MMINEKKDYVYHLQTKYVLSKQLIFFITVGLYVIEFLSLGEGLVIHIATVGIISEFVC